MSKFRRKQTEVQAVQFVDGRYGEAIDLCQTLIIDFAIVNDSRVAQRARIGQKTVNNGDWIVKDADGVFSVTSDADFTTEYEDA